MSLRASLVMATVGRVAEIDRCVDSLAGQTCRDFELIVVDQNADDRLVPVISRARALGLDCHHLRQAEPNLCLARNTGIEHATGDVVAFPDDDCWYEVYVVEQALGRFERQRELDGLVIRWFETGEHAAGRIRFDEYARMRGPAISSITIFLRRDTLRQAGSFDMDLGLHSWYGAAEETDLMLRLLHSGAIVEYAPDIWVHHAVLMPTSQPPAQMFAITRRRARGTGALYARHPLPSWVVMRGLLSPWFGALMNLLKPRMATQKLGLGLGRLEGFVAWRLGYRLTERRRSP